MLHLLLNHSLFWRYLEVLEFPSCSLTVAIEPLHYVTLKCFSSARFSRSSRLFWLSFLLRLTKGAIAKTVKPRLTFFDKFVMLFSPDKLSCSKL
jgi:hypothetical protein